jgi:DNA replication protein DnaC
MNAIEVDTARLPLLLQELRLPAIARLWPEFTERADKEGWPAARLLSALAELEIAERGRRRIERHLGEARLPPGKTLDNFDFAAVPMLSKARVMALAAGDAWLDKASNLLLFGPPGAGKSHCAAAIGRALVVRDAAGSAETLQDGRRAAGHSAARHGERRRPRHCGQRRR